MPPLAAWPEAPCLVCHLPVPINPANYFPGVEPVHDTCQEEVNHPADRRTFKLVVRLFDVTDGMEDVPIADNELWRGGSTISGASVKAVARTIVENLSGDVHSFIDAAERGFSDPQPEPQPDVEQDAIAAAIARLEKAGLEVPEAIRAAVVGR
jgi:hypothetical protein